MRSRNNDKRANPDLVFVACTLAIILVMIAATSRKPRAQTWEYTVAPFFDLTNVAQSVKASPGVLLYVSCFNPNAAAAFVQVFNSIGVVTVGTTVPVLSFQVQPTSASGQLSPSSSVLSTRPVGPYYATAGLQAAATTTATGATAPTSALTCDFGHR